MPTTPTPADRPADQLRAAAYLASTPAELATLLTRLADASDHHGTGEGGVVATLVHPALAVARQLLGTTEGEDDDESCGRFVPDTPRAPGLCASCGDAKGWHSLLATTKPAAPPASADRAAVLRVAAGECDKAGGIYASRGQNEHAGAAFALMETFRRQAEEAEYVATPCSFGGCEPGGEPCTTHERLMAHAEGDHELCDHKADRAATGAEWAALLNQAADRMKSSWFTDEATAAAAKATMRRLADDAAAGVQPPTTTEAHPPSYPWSQSVHSVDGGQTIHITWDDPDGNPGGSVRVDASDRNALAFMLADGAPGSDDGPDAPPLRCSVANLRRWPHPPHHWEPQPGMNPVRCPGTPPAAPAAPEEPQ